MNWIEYMWPMATGAFLTMALVHLWTGLRQAGRRVNLLFAISAIFAAIYSWFELGMVRAGSPAEFLARLRFLDLAAGGVAVSLVVFVWDYFGTGRKWLGQVAIGVMLGSLIPDLLPVPKLVFLEITVIRKVSTFGGATYNLAEGLSSPWNVVFYLGIFLLLAFVADASVTLWQGGGRRKALVVGGAVILFYLFGGLQASLTDLGVLKTPYLVAFCWMAILVVMAWELSNDQLRAERLAHALRENQERMTLAAKAAELNLWEWDIARDEIWSTEKGRERTGIAAPERINLERYLQVMHPEDREPFRGAVHRALEGDGDFEAEYRLITPTGRTLWISTRGQMERETQGKPIRMRGISVDVTERKQAQLALERSEQLARLLLNATTDLTELLDEDGTILDLNDAMATRLGGTRDGLIGNCVFDRLAREMAGTKREQLSRALLEQQPVRFTDRGRPDVVYDVSIYPIPMPAGEKGRAVVFAHDITEREKVLRALRKSEERLRLSQQVAHVGSFDWNIETGVNVWTPELEALYGLPPGGFAKTQPAWEKLVHPDDRALATGTVNVALQTGRPVEGEWRVVWPDGSIRWLSGRFQAFKNEAGQPVRLAGVNIDITARKQAEEQFRLVVEASPNALVMANSEGLMTLVNPQTESLFGYTRAELIGQPVELLVPERLRSQHRSHRDAYCSDPSARTMETRRELIGRRKDGSEFPVEIGLNPIRTPAGLSVLATIVDITGRKAAEAELQRQRLELARIQRVSTMGHLASTLAHELNQPLGAILRNAEAGELFLQQNPPDYEEVQAILADIKRENHRAGEVIDRTRSLLKRRQPEPGRIRLKELLHQLAGLVHSESQTRRVVLHIDVAEELPPARGDSVQVQQVLLNLVINAMDAMDETPVEQRQVVVTARLADALFLELAVSDRGHGISEDKLPHIFDSFFTTKSKGLGMGLAISQTIIRSHGGRIWTENNPEGGTTFKFTLKVAGGEGQVTRGERARSTSESHMPPTIRQ